MFKKNHIDLDGKVVLTTGAGSGIGAATARLLFEQGAILVLVDVNEQGINGLATEFGQERALALSASVTDRTRLNEVVEISVEHFGGIDIVFATAGIACDPPTTARDMDENVFERIIEADLLGVSRTVMACLPQIVSRKGHVLVTASTSAFINGVANIPYGMAKAGVEMFGRSLRVELAGLGASAGVLFPCWTLTPIAHSALGGHELATALVEQGFPKFLRNPITPEQVAKAAVKGMQTRAASIYRPRRWAFVSLVRGIFNPISDWMLCRDKKMQSLLFQLEDASKKDHKKTGR